MDTGGSNSCIFPPPELNYAPLSLFFGSVTPYRPIYIGMILSNLGQYPHGFGFEFYPKRPCTN